MLATGNVVMTVRATINGEIITGDDGEVASE